MDDDARHRVEGHRADGLGAVDAGVHEVAHVDADPADAPRREPIGERARDLYRDRAQEHQRLGDGRHLAQRRPDIGHRGEDGCDREPTPARRAEGVGRLPQLGDLG